MKPSDPPPVRFGPPPKYSGWWLGIVASGLQAFVLAPFWFNATKIPPGTPIRPMGLAAWLVLTGMLGLCVVVPVSALDLRRAWNLQDRRGVWRSVGGAALGLAAGPGAFAAFYGIVNLNGLILAD